MWISPDARKEVLKRLLKLNHEIHEQEVKVGLHAKGKSKKKQKAYAPEQMKLFKKTLKSQGVKLRNQRPEKNYHVNPVSKLKFAAGLAADPQRLSSEKSYYIQEEGLLIWNICHWSRKRLR